MRKIKANAIMQEPTLSDANKQDFHRLVNLFALFLVKGESQNQKIKMLSGCGYSPSEIGNMLGITSNAARVALHRIRKENAE